MRVTFLPERLRGTDSLRDLDIDDQIILKIFLKKCNLRRCELDLFILFYGPKNGDQTSDCNK
jgi:hypothetical protein